jgi:hypothetical protein
VSGMKILECCGSISNLYIVPFSSRLVYEEEFVDISAARVSPSTRSSTRSGPVTGLRLEQEGIDRGELERELAALKMPFVPLELKGYEDLELAALNPAPRTSVTD